MIFENKKTKRHFAVVLVVISLIFHLVGCGKSTVNGINGSSDPATMTAITPSNAKPGVEDTLTITGTFNAEKTAQIQGHLLLKVSRNGAMVSTIKGADSTLNTTAAYTLSATVDLRSVGGLKAGDTVTFDGQLETTTLAKGATLTLSNNMATSVTVTGTSGVSNPPDFDQLYLDQTALETGGLYTATAVVGKQGSTTYATSVRINCGTGADQEVGVGNVGEDISGQTYTAQCQYPRAGTYTVSAQVVIPSDQDKPSDVTSRTGHKKQLVVRVVDPPKPTPLPTSSTTTQVTCPTGQQLGAYGCYTPAPNPSVTTSPSPSSYQCPTGQLLGAYGCYTPPSPNPSVTTSPSPTVSTSPNPSPSTSSSPASPSVPNASISGAGSASITLSGITSSTWVTFASGYDGNSVVTALQNGSGTVAFYAYSNAKPTSGNRMSGNSVSVSAPASGSGTGQIVVLVGGQIVCWLWTDHLDGASSLYSGTDIPYASGKFQK